MSADRISVCPRCRAKAIAKSEMYEKRAYDGYGTISQADFEDVQYKLHQANQEAKATNLLESYSVFMQVDGILFVSYGCRCKVCNWEWSIEKTFNSNEEIKS